MSPAPYRDLDVLVDPFDEAHDNPDQAFDTPQHAEVAWFREQPLDRLRRPHVARQRKAVRQLRSAAHESPHVTAYEAKLLEHLGFGYGFCDRCGQYNWNGCSRREHDCSGMQCWASNELGVNLGCTTSFVIAQMAYDAGLGITYDDLMSGMPGWAFRGADNGRRDDGSRPNGASGHIVYVNMATEGPFVQLPSGLHVPGTIEAMGRAYGCLRGVFNRTRQFTGFSKILGFDYSIPVQRQQERDMIIQNFHYSASGARGAHCSGQPGFHACWVVSSDGKALIGNGDASIANDAPLDANTPKRTRIYRPGNLGSRTIVGLAKRGDEDGAPLHGDGPPGPIMVLDDNTQLVARFS